MKYCEEYAALLDLYVDGELPAAEMERVQAHLETCPGCRGYVDDALVIRAGFPDIEDTVVPEGFAARVMERVREDAGKDAKIVELKRRSARRRAGTFAALAACCALAVFARTGPGGLSGGSDSASMVTASAGGAAPAGYAMDTGGAEASDDARHDLQMATGPTTAPEEVEAAARAAQIEGEAGMAATAMDREADMDSADAGGIEAGGIEKEASPSGYAEYAECEDETVSPTAPAALPEASKNVVCTAAGGEAALYLTAEEAGDILEGYTPVRETVIVMDDALAGLERWYELTEEEYRWLLDALGRPAGAAAPPVLVVVTGPFE